ncbi:MAG TPA: cupin domain-containing protein [Allosphingosinicella sp.]|nr:cupin domain-containing protein [Allosphingosinicella sp.]
MSSLTLQLDAERFLSGYWQKRALLIRDPWGSWSNPLDPDELAGLACEDEVESRLVTGAYPELKVEHGPFAETRFAGLGREPWTLLVQAVDHHVPSVAALLRAFRFIPNWRVDDVMVSYAADGAGVGPHFDQYDVFLIQGLGKRRWRVGAMCDSSTPLLPHEDLRLLQSFEATGEYVLEPGDVLYLPPGIAHEGVAVGDDCMTYSVGFRAPSRSELIEGWSRHLLSELQEDDRYSDPDLEPQDNPGEIAPEAMARLHSMTMEKLLDRDSFARWFGRHSTEPKYPDMDWRPEQPMDPEELRQRLATGAPLSRNPASRFSFVRSGSDCVLLFVDGECFECTGGAAAFAEQLCAQDQVSADGSATALIAALIDRGSIAFED